MFMNELWGLGVRGTGYDSAGAALGNAGRPPSCSHTRLLARWASAGRIECSDEAMGPEGMPAMFRPPGRAQECAHSRMDAVAGRVSSVVVCGGQGMWSDWGATALSTDIALIYRGRKRHRRTYLDRG